jgi:hypothetical protein
VASSGNELQASIMRMVRLERIKVWYANTDECKQKHLNRMGVTEKNSIQAYSVLFHRLSRL